MNIFHILELDLVYFPIDDCPAFPFVFQGVNLRLSGFNLEKWNGECLPNVQKFSLYKCCKLTELPFLPKAQEINLGDISDLVHLSSSFPSCKKLEIHFCELLETVTLTDEFSPNNCNRKSGSLKIHSCEALTSVKGITGFMIIDIYDRLPSLEEIRWIGHHHQLTIKAIPSLAEKAQAFLNKYEMSEEWLLGFQSIDHLITVHQGNRYNIVRNYW